MGNNLFRDNPANPIIAVAQGFQHSLALAADGSVYAFGFNSNGQLGDGTTIIRNTPIRVLKGAYTGTTYLGDNATNPIIGITCGVWHSTVHAADGTVFSFGYNNNGQLGDGTMTNRTLSCKST
ncbi:MAG: hypothetical protein IPK03_09805 [Bacteroidetes bacterium]|nr:hypothetical protein [Bacteroidota bacterium]